MGDHAAPPPASRDSSVGADYRRFDGPNSVGLDRVRISSIHAALAKICMSERFADMVITCGGRTFHAHSAILCPQSEFFDRALTGGFSESASKTINLPDDDPAVLTCFLQYIYTGNYDDGMTRRHPGPADPALADPADVAAALDEQPNVVEVGPPRPDDLIPSEDEEEEEEGEGEERAEGDDEAAQSGTAARSEYSPGPNSPVEPPEEYGEFDELEDDDGNDGDNDVNANAGADDDNEHDNGNGAAGTRAAPSAGTDHRRRLSHRWDLDKIRTALVPARSAEIFLHMRIYVMADKFAVPPLKLLSRDRFFQVAQVWWWYIESFTDLIDELYTTTAPGNVAMREIVCRLVGESIYDPEVRDWMAPVMKKHGEFAFGVLSYVMYWSPQVAKLTVRGRLDP